MFVLGTDFLFLHQSFIVFHDASDVFNKDDSPSKVSCIAPCLLPVSFPALESGSG